MAGKLSAAFVRTVKDPGKYGDGGGLMVLVHKSGRKQFVQRLSIQGNRRDLGLGPYPEVSLAQARKRADENRVAARNGDDPTARTAGTPTFKEAAERVIALHAPSWATASKSEAQWRASLATYVYPVIGARPVGAITTADVMSLLTPIWNTKRVTARRVRQRVGVVMRWAIAEGYRSDNPAGDAIEAAMPKNKPREEHHPAVPHDQVREVLAKVRASRSRLVTRLALEFLILTAVRSAEVRLARWDEIRDDTWTVPWEHTKNKEEHVVPLSSGALAVLRAVPSRGDREGLIFASKRGQGALADATMSKLLRRLKVAGVPHGFRSSFTDWCSEGGISREVAEAALGHTGGPYARSDLLEERRPVMERWSEYVAGCSAK